MAHRLTVIFALIIEILLINSRILRLEHQKLDVASLIKPNYRCTSSRCFALVYLQTSRSAILSRVRAILPSLVNLHSFSDLLVYISNID